MAILTESPGTHPPRLELAVILPTLNEHDNIVPILERLERTLQGIVWEVIFVDDDSVDGTSALLAGIGLHNPRVRFLRRVGRRGLSSACVEGMLSTAAPYMAVMDADLQHDEKLLPRMLDTIRSEQLDLVIGSRNLESTGMGEFGQARVRLSHLGALISRLLPSAAGITDPMSGFFMVDRRFMERAVHRASGIGFKILLDLIASSPTPPRFKELPYRFGARQHGVSKLDLGVGVDFIVMMADKLIGELVPVQFVMFVLAGIPGLLVHLILLGLLLNRAGWTFPLATAAATYAAMTLNFFMNNSLTYFDQKLRGGELLKGLVLFWLVCSVGALASLSIGEFLFEHGAAWYLAGLTGMTVASVWNFAVTRALAWRKQRTKRR